MKKALLISIFFLTISLISAQDLGTKIPSNASAVFTIKGKNITDLVSTTEFENSKLGKLFLAEMIKDTGNKASNLASLGIDLSQNFYYFLQTEKGVLAHSFLIPLNNKESFLNLLSDTTKDSLITEDNITYFLDEFDARVSMFNDDMLLVLFLQDENKYDDYGYNYDYDLPTEDVEGVVEEASSAISSGWPTMNFEAYDYYFDDVEEGEKISHSFNFTNTGNSVLFIGKVEATCGCTVANFPKEGIEPGDKGTIDILFDTKGLNGSQSRTINITSNTEYRTESLFISGYILERVDVAVPDDENPAAVKESSIEDSGVITITETSLPECDSYGYSYNNDYYAKEQEEINAKREVRRQENLLVAIDKAKIIMAGNYDDGGILKNSNYQKAAGNGTDEAIFWVNDFGTIYDEILTTMFGSSLGYNPYDLFDIKSFYGGMSLTSKLNFQETQATINTAYTMNDQLASYSQAIYNGNLNKNFFNYFNEDEVQGYLSVNMSTEGVLKAYPQMIESMFAGMEKEHIGDLVAIGTRVASILLDEEAIAKAFRGDMLFVMTGLEQTEVNYTTYEYDENYESTEVTKTKTETLPKFIYMVTSEEQEIFNRLMRIGIKEKTIVFENGIYKLTAPDLPFTLNMFFKGNTLLVGNSTKDMMAISNNTYKAKVSKKHKKLMSNNATTLYINGKLMANQISAEAIPAEFKEKLSFIKDNVEDLVFRIGQVKGNTVDGEMIFNTPTGKGHKNSLAYFMNMIEVLAE